MQPTFASLNRCPRAGRRGENSHGTSIFDSRIGILAAFSECLVGLGGVGRWPPASQAVFNGKRI